MSRRVAVTGETLSSIDAFRALGAEERSEIARLCVGAVHANHDVVVSRDTPGTAVYFIVSGAVDVTVYSETGKETRFTTQRAGEMFGEMAALDDQPRSADIQCAGESFLLTMSAEDFRSALHTWPAFNDFVLRHLVAMVRRLSQRVHEFNVLTARQRLCAELLRLTQSDGNGSAEIEHPPTQAALAAKISTHRELISRELGRLIRDGVIAKREKRISVLNMERLQQLASERDSFSTQND